ncbi:MAG TPA: glycosyl transferase family 28, partial [Micromonosporaceae bacterium]|nr:glycosyl transferase family 28 [Micromonosporaceae bacterium]HZN77695.1 glycosyl transferase family 28 [Micromonosporaceae bacterium]
MRVLFTTFAWPSHYFPMVPLAWALQAAGHEVRMTSQPELLPTMRRSG